MGNPVVAVLTNTVSHDDDDDDEEGNEVERIAYEQPGIATTPQHTQQTDNDSIPSIPPVPSPYSPPSQSLMSATEEWMLRRRSRTATTNKSQPSNHHNANKPPALIHTTSSSWHEDEELDEDPISLQQEQQFAKAKTECQKLSKENNELKHQLQKQTHNLLQRSRDYEQRQKALQQKWQSALLQLDKAKAMNHELKTNFQKQLQQAQAQANDWQEQCQKILLEQQQQPRRGKHVKEPIDAACQTDAIPIPIPQQNTAVACQTEVPVDACRSISCQTDDELVVSANDAATQTDPTQFASSLEERLGRIRDAAERAALVQEHQAALQQMQTTHETELERLEKQHDAALAQMVQQARQHVQEQVAEHRHKIEQQHATKMAALETQHQAELFRVRQEYEKSANVAEEVMRAAVAEANTTAQQLQREMEARAALEKQLQQHQKQQIGHSQERQLLVSIQEECNAIFNRQRGVVSSTPAVVSPPKSSGSTWAEADRTLDDLEALVASLTNK